MLSIAKPDNTIIIPFDGGPCGGKTTIMSVASREVSDKGWTVYVAPEQATLLKLAGMQIKEAIALAVEKGDIGKLVQYESILLGAYYNFRQMLFRCIQIELDAGNMQKSVIFEDRAEIGIRAYLPQGSEGDDIFKEILRENDLRIGDLMKFYEDSGMIHMTTAAKGAEEFYTTANNEARDESPEVARMIDQWIEDAWNGLVSARIVGNESSFDAKIKNALGHVYHFLGEPEHVEKERKYLVASLNGFFAGIEQNEISIRHTPVEQNYLVADEDESRRIRKRTLDHTSMYYFTRKRDVPGHEGERIETEEMISSHEYRDMFHNERDLSLLPITKDRYCFVWGGKHFELDVFDGHLKGLVLLEVELTNMNDDIELPPFLKIEREVTGIEDYNNENLAHPETAVLAS